MTTQASVRDKAVGDGPQTVVTIVDMLDDLGAGRDVVSFGKIIDTLGARGFGPLLFGLAVLLVLPIGMIPGVGGAIGVVMAVIGVQMLRGRGRVWLPRFIRRRCLSAQRLKHASDLLRPRMEWLRRHTHQRLTPLAEGGLSLRVIAALLILAGLGMAIFGAIPILPPLMGASVLFFALGLTTRDGAAVVLGYLLVLLPVAAILAL